MSKRENILVIDTETAGSINAPLVYDLGIAVVQRATGEILETRSLIISDIFVGRAADMQSAYYAEKIPMYRTALSRGHMQMVDFWSAWRIVRHLVKKHNIKRVYAYNASFDVRALDNTMRVLTSGNYRHFLPRTVKVCCIMNMACQTVLKQKAYARFARANGFVSEYGNIRSTAEACYAYITKNPGFIESHTGLDDAIIETAILHHILRQKKRVDEKPCHNAWRKIQVKPQLQLEV